MREKRDFVKENINIQKSHETRSISLVLWDMQIKNIKCYHLTPVRMTIIKRKKTQVGRDVQ